MRNSEWEATLFLSLVRYEATLQRCWSPLSWSLTLLKDRRTSKYLSFNSTKSTVSAIVDSRPMIASGKRSSSEEEMPFSWWLNVSSRPKRLPLLTEPLVSSILPQREWKPEISSMVLNNILQPKIDQRNVVHRLWLIMARLSLTPILPAAPIC